MPYFAVRSSGLDAKFILREYRFSINSKVSFMSSGDNPILTWKISVKNFCRFRHFVDFDFKIALLAKLVSSHLPSVELSIVY